MFEVTPDLFNGMFEFVSACLFIFNIRIILRDKAVQGVSLIPAGFFTVWSVWNIYYYSHLEQWFSLAGGIFLMIVNIIWISLALYYSKRTSK